MTLCTVCQKGPELVQGQDRHPDEIFQDVAIEKLKTHPKNPRRGDVPAIMRSLERHGYKRGIVVQRKTGYILAGNGTTEAMRRLGWDKVPHVLVTDVSDSDALQYLLADNKTADRAKYDPLALNDVLGEALGIPGALESSGFSEEEVGEITKRAHPANGDGSPSFERETPSQHVDPPVQIPIWLPSSRAEHLRALIRALAQHYGTVTETETIERAVEEDASAHAAVSETVMKVVESEAARRGASPA